MRMRLTDDVFSTHKMAVSEEEMGPGRNHYETPGWSQSACITLLAFRLLSWYMGAEAPFRALSLVWWEDNYFSSSKYFPLVTCKTMYRHVCLPLNILVRINIYTGRKPCVLLVFACAGEKKSLKEDFLSWYTNML